ncbi:hypothetical protein ACFPVX_23580 [Cohnella faecalis]|uniref:RCK N-terminal domain-containing protein n=1 Tax=Cohnella faecalis TaxID=2315694 RepID=A0A398CQR8_9BACL|nr:hypothetical protein [Cohnella faecalis]RIE02167.1 hypothetical protein D3H35_15580 [Cohnella faecalis]
MEKHEMVLVSAPNIAGESFLKLLQRKSIPYAVIVNNKTEYERIAELGAPNIIVVNTTKENSWVVPEASIGKVYLFEKSLNLCCRYIQICRSWTRKPIYVVTGSHNPRLVYKGLGADYVIHSEGPDFTFLIGDDIGSRKA